MAKKINIQNIPGFIEECYEDAYKTACKDFTKYFDEGEVDPRFHTETKDNHDN